MNTALIAFFSAIGLSVFTILGDILIKNASLQSAFSGWKLLVMGTLIYALTGLGWFFVMRNLKLSTLGVIYSLSIVVMLALVSVFYFNEKLSTIEIIAIAMALCSLILLARFN